MLKKGGNVTRQNIQKIVKVQKLHYALCSIRDDRHNEEETILIWVYLSIFQVTDTEDESA